MTILGFLDAIPCQLKNSEVTFSPMRFEITLDFSGLIALWGDEYQHLTECAYSEKPVVYIGYAPTKVSKGGFEHRLARVDGHLTQLNSEGETSEEPMIRAVLRFDAMRVVETGDWEGLRELLSLPVKEDS